MKALMVQRTEMGMEDDVLEGQEGILWVMQRVADNVCLFFHCTMT